MNPLPQTERPPGRTVRDLMRAQAKVAIATSMAECEAAPYASLAIVAVGHDASPLLLLSQLADHTRNLDADPRISLLFDGTAGLASPLTGARASVQGTAVPTDDGLLLARFVRRHPEATIYAGFGDFRLFRVEVKAAHLVAGFGRIHWIGADEILLDTRRSTALAAEEAAAVEHMNADHADAIDLYARLAGATEPGWMMTGIDPEGADLRRAGEVLRVPFEEPAHDAEGARRELVRRVRRARGQSGS